MSPVASAFASITGSCNCGTITVVTNRTRSVHADSAPSSVSESGLSNAIRSPQHSDENGPSSITRAHAFSVAGVEVGFHHRQSHPDSHAADSGMRVRAERPSTTWQHEAMTISANSVSHVRLTVTDIARSRQFYEIRVRLARRDRDARGRRRRDARAVGLPVRRRHLQHRRRADRAAARRRRPLRRGPGRAWTTCASGSRARPNWTRRQRISTISASHTSRSRTSAHGYILEFRDPDNIALELMAPK